LFDAAGDTPRLKALPDDGLPRRLEPEAAERPTLWCPAMLSSLDAVSARQGSDRGKFRRERGFTAFRLKVVSPLHR